MPARLRLWQAQPKHLAKLLQIPRRKCCLILSPILCSPYENPRQKEECGSIRGDQHIEYWVPVAWKHYLYFWHYLLIIFARIRSQNCLKLIWSSEWAFEVSVRPSITTYHFLTASHRGKVQELLQYFQCHQWWLSLWQAPCLIPKYYQLKWNSTGVKGSRTLGINNHCHCGKRLA